MSLDAGMPISSPPRYARFSRRLRGMLLDWIIALIVIFGTVLVASTVGSDNFSRTLGFLALIALLLYEPVLVSLTGGTLGHFFSNLRVVDDGNGGNVSFAKACARVVIKGLLGWYSFVILAATRRNQAVHDLLTRSTVQIRDPTKALPGQYIAERSASMAANVPSRGRRVAVICIYLALAFVAFVAILGGMMSVGLMSARCLDNNFCSAGERIISLAASLTLLAATALVVTLGWKGRLFGARKA